MDTRESAPFASTFHSPPWVFVKKDLGGRSEGLKEPPFGEMSRWQPGITRREAYKEILPYKEKAICH